LVGLVLESGELLSLASAQRHPRFRLLPAFGGEVYRAFLGVPIT
jgi:signal transduction protein with GAF and PtsI domain